MRILVVEDEKKVAKTLREGLEAEHSDSGVEQDDPEVFLVDPELFQTQSGQAVARFSIATNEVWTGGANNSHQRATRRRMTGNGGSE